MTRKEYVFLHSNIPKKSKTAINKPRLPRVTQKVNTGMSRLPHRSIVNKVPNVKIHPPS